MLNVFQFLQNYSRVALIVVIQIFIYYEILDWAAKERLCLSKLDYFSDQDFIRIGFKYLGLTYNVRSDITKNGKKFKNIPLIPYQNDEDFFSKNPNCCRVLHEYTSPNALEYPTGTVYVQYIFRRFYYLPNEKEESYKTSKKIVLLTPCLEEQEVENPSD